MSRPKLLDVFSGSGGAAMGYFRAGFDPYGIDNDQKPLKHYPFPYLCMDALEAMDRLLRGEGLTFSNGETLYLGDFAAFHASPPCQFGSIATPKERKHLHPNLIPQTRQLLVATGKPYVIENVRGTRMWLVNPSMLCGTMFGLPLWRHRYFETSFNHFELMPTCNHKRGYLEIEIGKIQIPVLCTGGGDSKRSNRKTWRPNQPAKERRYAMQIDWMTKEELTQAIPPAYTEYIGKWLIKEVLE